MKTVLGYV